MASEITKAPANEAAQRNDNIDGLRLIAAIGVIALHVGPYPELPNMAGDVIRSAFRWCVPFFFMVTGYFLFDPRKLEWRVTPEKLSMVLRAFVVASVIFLPVLLANSGADGINLSILLRGTNYHLWYLPALVIAVLTVCTYQTGRAVKLLWCASVLILVGYIAISYFHVFTGKRQAILVTFRELSGIPAVLVGGWLRRVFNLRFVASSLFATGLILSIIEAAFLSAFDARPADAEFLIGTLPLAVGVLGLAVSSKNLTPAWLAEIGRRESLGIYLYHPLAIILVANVLSIELRMTAHDTPGLPTWILASILTTGGLLLLRTRHSRLTTILQGAR